MNYFMKLPVIEKTKLFFLILVLMLLAVQVQAGLFQFAKEKQETRKYPEVPSILDVYYMALENDNQIAAAKYRSNAEKEARALAWSSFLPKANLNVYTRISDNTTESEINFIEPETNYNENGYTLVVNQTLLDLPALIALPESKLRSKKSDLKLLEQEQNLIARVATNYIDLIVAQSNLAVVETQEKAIEELLEQAKLNFELGTATITDTHEAQAARDVVHAQSIAVRNKLKTLKHELYTLTGHHFNDVVKFEKDLPLDLKDFELPSLKELEEIALKANLRLNMARIDHALAKMSLRKTQTSRLPKLNLVATYGENNANGSVFGTTESDTEFNSIGAELNMPLMAGGAINSNVRRARNTYKEKTETLELVKKQTLLQLREAYLNVDLALSSLKAFRLAVQTAKLSLDSTLLGFKLGERTSLDVLSAQQTYYQAVRDHTESQYSYLIASLGLSLSLGLVSEDNIIFIADLAEKLNSGKL